MKYYAVLFLSLFIFGSSFSFAKPVFADETVVNAGILPTIWYSTTSVYAGDTVTIYGGIQNHSDGDISGSAAFYVDGVSAASVPFSSKSQSLMEVSYPWQATLGKHTIKIVLSVPVNLLANESNATALTVTAPPIGTSNITFPTQLPTVVTKELKNVDTFADSMASTVQSLKIKPNTASANQKGSLKKGGVNSSATALNAISQNSVFQNIYNKTLDCLAFIIHHWAWTIIIILVIILIVRFF